jgi:alkyl hydroperoxide reductase subunit AhpC|tara:strand:- start:18453 stop:18674 length:222 start_codon:yes stop_codon:yes gene_type:complete
MANKYKLMGFEKETEQIDKLLKEMAAVNAELGRTSTDFEKKKAWKKIINRELKIKEIDLEFYKEICPDSEDYL